MIIRFFGITFFVLFTAQCISTRNWMAENLLGVQIADDRDIVLKNATGPICRPPYCPECLVENNVRTVHSYRLTPQQRVEAMQKIRAAGIDYSNLGDVVYVPVSPSQSGGEKSERHYMRYDTNTGTLGKVVVLKD